MQSLNDIFEGKAPEAVPEPQQPVTPEPVAEPQGVKDEPGVEPPSPETVQERMVPLKALEEERRKRQEAEARINQQEPKRAPDIFEDPEGYQKHMTELLNQTRTQDRIALSREMLMIVKDDYEQRENEFLELAKQDEMLIAKMANSSNPAKFVYETAVKAEKAKQLENVDQYEAKLRAEIEAKVRSEFEAKAKKDAALKASIPTSLVDAPSKGSIKGNEWSGPTPLKNLFKR